MSQTPLTSGSKLDEILHALIFAGISAASIFVKNPSSQQHAATLINLVQGTLVPLADSLLNKPEGQQSTTAVVD